MERSVAVSTFLVLAGLGAAAAVPTTGCSSRSTPAQATLRGRYEAHGPGPISSITFFDATRYAVSTMPCSAGAGGCMHVGTYVLSNGSLALTDSVTHRTTTIPFAISASHPGTFTTQSLHLKDVLTGGSSSGGTDGQQSGSSSGTSSLVSGNSSLDSGPKIQLVDQFNLGCTSTSSETGDLRPGDPQNCGSAPTLDLCAGASCPGSTCLPADGTCASTSNQTTNNLCQAAYCDELGYTCDPQDGSCSPPNSGAGPSSSGSSSGAGDTSSSCLAAGFYCDPSNPGQCCSNNCMNSYCTAPDGSGTGGGSSSGATSCLAAGADCDPNNSSQCCSQNCDTNNQCTAPGGTGSSSGATSCLAAGADCDPNNSSQCCSQNCDTSNHCTAPGSSSSSGSSSGGSCTNDTEDCTLANECCSNQCNSNKKCGCVPSAATCVLGDCGCIAPSDCCSGLTCNSTGQCVPLASGSSSGGSSGSSSGGSCTNDTEDCTLANECCSNQCNSNKKCGCVPSAATCVLGDCGCIAPSDCCSGLTCNSTGQCVPLASGSSSGGTGSSSGGTSPSGSSSGGPSGSGTAQNNPCSGVQCKTGQCQVNGNGIPTCPSSPGASSGPTGSQTLTGSGSVGTGTGTGGNGGTVPQTINATFQCSPYFPTTTGATNYWANWSGSTTAPPQAPTLQLSGSQLSWVTPGNPTQSSQVLNGMATFTSFILVVSSTMSQGQSGLATWQCDNNWPGCQGPVQYSCQAQ